MSTENRSYGIEQPSQEMALMHMIHGCRISQLIYVVAKLGIADLLHDGPKNSDQLAQAVRVHPQALYRVLRALASLGIFSENEEGAFQLTPVAAFLRKGIPGSLAGYAIMVGESWSWRAEGDLLYSVKTGKTAFAHVHGMDIHAYLNQDTEAAEHFNAAMSSFSGHELEPIFRAYDFSKFGNIIDVGGGHGALLSALLKANPKTYGTLFELSDVIEAAGGMPHMQEVRGRCELVPGDFFQSLPDDGDVYILKRVIHDWDDERAMAILMSCRRAMSDKARLLLMERIIPTVNASSFGKLVDISMLVLSGGQERTEAEFRTLLEKAGFTLVDIIKTQCPLSIIEAIPAGEL